MGLDVERLADEMEQLFKNIEVEEGIKTLGNLKEDLKIKASHIKVIKDILTSKKGSITKEKVRSFNRLEREFLQLHDNFDDKLMLFIVGNGNAGKSTLLNSLVGEKVAVTGTLPSTWKIDVYSNGLKKNEAILKYSDRESKKVTIEIAKRVVEEEEKKTKEAKKRIDQEKRKALKGLRTKEERDDMKRYIEKEFSYISNLSEVVWPVESNWLLDKCLLVDTPGLNQNLNNASQIGSIYSYYHKADGVIWILDGQTIAAQNASEAFKVLDEELKEFSDDNTGVRNNIIGVINRMDLVEKNGGKEAVKKVLDDAHRFFGDKFYKIIDISAYKAEEGIIQNDDKLIKESNIENLHNIIKEIFIAKSEMMKNGAKLQGHNKLVKSTMGIIKEYEEDIYKFQNMHQDKLNQLNYAVNTFNEEFENEISSFIDKYLVNVSRRVDESIDELANGKKQDFIIDEMYRLDEFRADILNFADKRKNELANKYQRWLKNFRVSEYKYIDIEKNEIAITTIVNTNVDISRLANIEYFMPSNEEDFFSLLGNLFGKGMFMFRKNKIRNTINSEIENKAKEIKRDLIDKFRAETLNKNNQCIKNLNDSFENILFEIDKVKNMEIALKVLRMNMGKDKQVIGLRDILK